MSEIVNALSAIALMPIPLGCFICAGAFLVRAQLKRIADALEVIAKNKDFGQ